MLLTVLLLLRCNFAGVHSQSAATLQQMMTSTGTMAWRLQPLERTRRQKTHLQLCSGRATGQPAQVEVLWSWTWAAAAHPAKAARKKQGSCMTLSCCAWACACRSRRHLRARGVVWGSEGGSLPLLDAWGIHFCAHVLQVRPRIPQVARTVPGAVRAAARSLGAVCVSAGGRAGSSSRGGWVRPAAGHC